MSKNVQDLLSATAYDNNGDKLGDVNEVFVDDDSGQPTFVDVNHGLFGMGNSLVPLRGHSIDGNNLTLAFPKDRIKDAPDFGTDKPLTPDQQTEIYEHYGISGASHVDGYTGGERPETTTDTADTDTHTDGDATDTDAGAGAAGAGVAGAGVAGASSTHTTDIPGNTAAETAAVGSTNVTENAGTTDAIDANSAQSGVPAGETRLRK